jgi:hypothetical protein
MSSGLLRRVVIVLTIEAASYSETSMSFYQPIRHNNPEGSHLHIRRRESRIPRYTEATETLRSNIFGVGNKTVEL